MDRPPRARPKDAHEPHGRRVPVVDANADVAAIRSTSLNAFYNCAAVDWLMQPGLPFHLLLTDVLILAIALVVRGTREVQFGPLRLTGT